MYTGAREVARQFKEDLQKLLKEYNTAIELEESESLYPHMKGGDKMMVYIPAKFAPDGGCVSESATVDLGRDFSDGY